MKRTRISIAITMVMALIFGMMPGMGVKAANAFTDIDYQFQNWETGDIAHPGMATLTLLNANYNSIEKDEYVIVCAKMEDNGQMGFFDYFRDNVDAGYDVFFYAPRIEKVYANWVAPVDPLRCTVTMPCPEGYDPSTAKLLYVVSTESTDKVPVASSTDNTLTMNLPIGVGVYSTEPTTSFMLDDHWFIEMHKHVPSTIWSHDEKTHWHACTNHCDKRLDEVEHTFDAGVKVDKKITYTCTVCGYQKVEDVKVAENEIVKDPSNAAEYKVTSVKEGAATVEFEKTEEKEPKKVKVPDTITLPDGTTAKVTSISAGALKNNKTVTNVTIGNNVETIGSGAFQSCPKLKSVSIGKNVTSIGGKAFKGCSKLNKITIKSTKIKKVGKNAFAGLKKGAIIKVPKKQKAAYEKLFKKAKLPAGVKIK